MRMYDVVEKLRRGTPLAEVERTIHELAACGVLRDLHDELDALVAEAYGWPWPLSREEILERLVALHDERVAEEAAGTIRWLRPDFQAPAAARVPAAREQELPLAAGGKPAARKRAKEAPAAAVPWPATAVDQIAALKALVARRPATPAEAATHFTGARRDLVTRHLETLELLGEVRATEAGRYAAAAPY